MVRVFVLMYVFASAPSLYAVTLDFDDAPFPAGSRALPSYTSQGFHLRGSFSHTGDSAFARPSNSTSGSISLLLGDKVQVIRPGGAFIIISDGNEQIPVEPEKLLFDAVSVDLAEYSTLFPFAAEVTFFGVTAAGQELTHTFTTDGVIDSLGGASDFESFQFPPTFRSLVSLTTHMPQIGPPALDGFAFDNLVLLAIPEPATALLLLAAFGLLLGRHKRPS